MRYWLLAGLHSKRFAEQLRQSLQRLEAGEYRTTAVVVESAEGVGHFSGALEEKRPGVVPFLATGMQHIRERAKPGDWFVRVDADDWYGREYLGNVDSVRRQGAVATGIQSPYVVTEKGKLYWGFDKSSGVTGFGGTLAGSVFDCPDFVAGQDLWGEDDSWVKTFLKSGSRYALRDSRGYAWARWDGHKHTFPFPGHCLLHMYNWDVRSLGDFSLEKIEETPHEAGERLEKDPQSIRQIFEIFRGLRGL